LKSSSIRAASSVAGAAAATPTRWRSARGHQNPFGSEGTFARKFIADNREQARQLKAEAREEFRSIVYGYMSRVRRGDGFQ
jgi:hypothetical protein